MQESAASRREKVKALLYLALVAAVILGIVAVLFVVPYLQDRAQLSRIKSLPIESIGASPSDAGCQSRVLRKVTLDNEDRHVDNDTALDYEQAPPAFGKHWAVPLTEPEYQVLFRGDRPAKEQLVHSLEHGYTVIWYDASLARDSAEMRVLADLMEQFQVKDAVVAAPWTRQDGAAFPAGTHLALTHWSVEDGEQGIWQYCRGVSGAAVKSFILDYPHQDAPEGGFV